MKKIIVLMFIIGTMFSNLYAVKVKEYLPSNFSKYESDLYKTVDLILAKEVKEDPYLDRLFFRAYFAALIEHESCISLKSKRCWSPNSRFKTFWDKPKNLRPREEGIGFGQLTRAWKRTGSLRFDTIKNLKRRYGKYLKDLSWKNVRQRPDLQLRAIMLLYRSNYINLPKSIDVFNRILFSDSMYNGGSRKFREERKICGLKANCDPKYWFGNVELINARGTRILYGKRTAHMINRHHVKDVINNRFKKYYFRSISNESKPP